VFVLKSKSSYFFTFIFAVVIKKKYCSM